MATAAQSEPPGPAAEERTTATPMETDEPSPNQSETKPPPPETDAPPPSEPHPVEQHHHHHPAATPGPRASRLQDLYAQSLRRTLGKLKWDNFAACYPTVAKRAEPVLKQVQGQMVEKLGEKCEKEFENIMAARQVVPKLNELESLISGASSRRSASSPDTPQPTPPHLLPAQSILAAHLAPSLASHQSLLNARLQTAQSHNAILYEEIQSQRAELESLLAMLDAAVGDVRGANAALAPVVEQLAVEARQADAEISAEDARL